MNKYYKAEDIIRKRAEDLADTSYWEYGNPKNVDDWIEIAEMEFADLPTIEVMEYPQVEDITPTLATPKNSEDCISRAKALEIYSDLYWIDERLLNFKDELDKVYEKLRNAPSVVPNDHSGEPTEKVGEWKWISPAGIYQCSVCGGTVMTQDIECYEYCHQCGAKIKGYKNE